MMRQECSASVGCWAVSAVERRYEKSATAWVLVVSWVWSTWSWNFMVVKRIALHGRPWGSGCNISITWARLQPSFEFVVRRVTAGTWIDVAHSWIGRTGRQRTCNDNKTNKLILQIRTLRNRRSFVPGYAGWGLRVGGILFSMPFVTVHTTNPSVEETQWTKEREVWRIY